MNENFKTVTLPLLAAILALSGLIVGSHVTLRDDLGARIQKVQDDVNILRGEVRGLESQVSGLRERVAGLEGRMESLEGRMAGLEVRVAGLEVRVASLEVEVRNVATGRAAQAAVPAAAVRPKPPPQDDPMA